MKAIGAGGPRIFRIIIGEAVLAGAVSAILAALLALPLTVMLDGYIASRGFLAPPPFAISWVALVAWPLAVIAGSALASALPAWRAARLSVRAALGEL